MCTKTVVGLLNVFFDVYFCILVTYLLIWWELVSYEIEVDFVRVDFVRVDFMGIDLVGRTFSLSLIMAEAFSLSKHQQRILTEVYVLTENLLSKFVTPTMLFIGDVPLMLSTLTGQPFNY